ncbi:hypothetical protein QN277_026129 [Acacia crassicarpa]|uniref:Uncharacterized protein n=1 Tax=Acacia crassicarpa TaxID=499986 RepID=A0AAE1K414_9FABA|nr:hypothetical protein QN277_026129 [Acacia crassicarpa]
MSSRHRPLLACTLSISAMADIAAIKSQDHLNGPLGSTLRTTAKLAKIVMSPLIYTMKYQWSIIVFFLDYLFQGIVVTMKQFCPSSSHALDKKIGAIVLMIESLPEKFADAIDKLPAIIYQYSFSIKRWTLVHLISWLNYLIITFNQMDQEDSRMKDIAIDNRNLLLPPESSDCLCTIDSFCSAAESDKDIGNISDRIDRDEGASERKEKDIDRARESERIVKFRDIGNRVIKQEEHPIVQLFESKWLSN